MAAKKGTGLLMVWADVPADKEAEFNRWYNEEHLAERLAIPGFLNGARYEAVKGGPKHLAVYELDTDDVASAAAALGAAATGGRMDMTPTMDLQTNPPDLQWYLTLPA